MKGMWKAPDGSEMYAPVKIWTQWFYTRFLHHTEHSVMFPLANRGNLCGS